MKIWHLEKEYDAFIAQVTSAREERKAGIRDAVQAIWVGRYSGKARRRLLPTPGN